MCTLAIILGCLIKIQHPYADSRPLTPRLYYQAVQMDSLKLT